MGFCLRMLASVTALTAALVLSSGRPAAAHPHVFIEAGITLFTAEDGSVSGVEVTWIYDELYSLVLLQDFGLDQDFDGRLTEAEVAGTLGFDLNWNSGFEGGLHLTRGAAELSIGPPEPVSMSLMSDGRMRTVHRRSVEDVIGTGPVEVGIYDAAFYIAFEASLPSEIEGSDCAPDIVRADLDAAYAALEAELASLGGAEAAEDDFPAVGALFADRLVFACAP